MKDKSVAKDQNKPFIPRDEMFDPNTRIALGVQNSKQRNMKVTMKKLPWNNEESKPNNDLWSMKDGI